MEYKGWKWLYDVYGVAAVDEDEVDSYIDVFERLLKDEEEDDEDEEEDDEDED